MLRALGKELALGDFDHAMQILDGISNPSVRAQIYRGLFELAAVISPLETLGRALALEPETTAVTRRGRGHRGMLFHEALKGTMAGWAFSDPEGAVAFLQDDGPHSGGYQASLLGTVYAVWARQDPQAALEKALGLERGFRTYVLGRVYDEWAAQDPEAAWRHVLGLPSSRLSHKSSVLGRVAARWAVKDLDRALAWVGAGIPDDTQQARITRTMVWILISRDPPTAARAMTLIPSLYEGQRGMITGLMRNWVGRDPETAANWSASLEAGELRRTAVKSAAAYWTSSDYDRALEWAHSLPAGMVQAYALSNVAVQQGQVAPDKSTDWISGLPPGFTRDRTIAGYVLGRVRRKRDGSTAYRLWRTIMSDEINLEDVATMIRVSSLGETERSSLLALLP
jgi:hypothetical protein